MRVSVDLSKFRGKMALVRRDIAAAGEIGVLHTHRRLAADVVRECPKDTNRLVRGFIIAYNALEGVGPFPVPPIVPSRFRDRKLKELLGQIKRINRLIGMKERSGETITPSLRRLKTARDRAKDEYNAYAQSKGTAILVINSDGRILRKTVRTKVYGGRATEVRDRGGALVSHRVENLEPHASIRERSGRDAGWLTRILVRHGVPSAAVLGRMKAVAERSNRTG
jgi:hypothetical protein